MEKDYRLVTTFDRKRVAIKNWPITNEKKYYPHGGKNKPFVCFNAHTNEFMIGYWDMVEYKEYVRYANVDDVNIINTAYADYFDDIANGRVKYIASNVIDPSFK